METKIEGKFINKFKGSFKCLEIIKKEIQKNPRK